VTILANRPLPVLNFVALNRSVTDAQLFESAKKRSRAREEALRSRSSAGVGSPSTRAAMTRLACRGKPPARACSRPKRRARYGASLAVPARDHAATEEANRALAELAKVRQARQAQFLDMARVLVKRVLVWRSHNRLSRSSWLLCVRRRGESALAHNIRCRADAPRRTLRAPPRRRPPLRPPEDGLARRARGGEHELRATQLFTHELSLPPLARAINLALLLASIGTTAKTGSRRLKDSRAAANERSTTRSGCSRSRARAKKYHGSSQSSTPTRDATRSRRRSGRVEARSDGARRGGKPSPWSATRIPV